MFGTQTPQGPPIGAQVAYAQQQEMAEQQRTAMLDQEVQQGVRRWTPTQKKQLSGLDQAMTWLQSQAGMPEHTRASEMQRLMGEKQGIIPPMVPADERPPTPEQEIEKSVITDPNGGVLVKNPKTGEWDYSKSAPQNQPRPEGGEQGPGSQFQGMEVAMAPGPNMGQAGQQGQGSLEQLVQSRSVWDPRLQQMMTVSSSGTPQPVPNWDKGIRNQKEDQQKQLENDRKQQEWDAKQKQTQQANDAKQAADLMKVYNDLVSSEEKRELAKLKGGDSGETYTAADVVIEPTRKAELMKEAQRLNWQTKQATSADVWGANESYTKQLEGEFSGLDDATLKKIVAEGGDVAKRATDEAERRSGTRGGYPLTAPAGYKKGHAYIPRGWQKKIATSTPEQIDGFRQHATREKAIPRRLYNEMFPNENYKQYLQMREWAKTESYEDDVWDVQQSARKQISGGKRVNRGRKLGQAQQIAAPRSVGEMAPAELMAIDPNVPEIKTDAEYAELTPGMEYRHPDGSVKRKPKQ